MTRLMPQAREPDDATWWLALVEVQKPERGVLFADEVEGAFAWAAAEARSRDTAETMIRQLFGEHGLVFGRFESMFETTLDDIDTYDRLLADQLSAGTPASRCARGALVYFAAEAEA